MPVPADATDSPAPRRVNSLGATHATVKVIGAAVGRNDAERKGQAIAIWMPSDTARAREACGK